VFLELLTKIKLNIIIFHISEIGFLSQRVLHSQSRRTQRVQMKWDVKGGEEEYGRDQGKRQGGTTGRQHFCDGAKRTEKLYNDLERRARKTLGGSPVGVHIILCLGRRAGGETVRGVRVIHVHV